MDDWFSHNVRAFFYVKELKYMKIFLTGQKQIGKSTCIRECVEECHVSICGFQTLPYMVDGKRMHYMIWINRMFCFPNSMRHGMK